MAEAKTLLVSKGTGTAVPMTASEYRGMMNALPPQARRNVSVRGNVSSIVTDTVSGKSTVEQLSHEQVSSRVDRGEDPVLTPGDPRRDLARRTEQKVLEEDIADHSIEARLAMSHRLTPILGQKAQDYVVGTDDSVEYRNKLLEANSVQTLGIDMGIMIAGMAVGGAVLSQAGFNMTTKGLTGFRNLMAAGAAQDTYAYATYLADKNIPFQGEDYGRALMTGALINLPLAGAAAVRGAALSAARTVAGGGADVLGTVADGFITKAVLSKPGTLQAATAARAGAGFRMISKLGRKIRGKQNTPLTIVSPLEDAEKFSLYQQKQIAKLEPKKLAGMDQTSRLALWDEVSGWAGVVDDITKQDFIKMTKSIDNLNTKAAGLDRQIDTTTQKLGTWTKGLGGRGSKKQQAAYIASMETTLAELDNGGWGKMVERLRDSTAVDPKTGKLLANHHAQFGHVVQARLAARLERSVTGGAAQADEALKKVINNSEIWGKGKHPRIAKELNDAIDELADAQIKLKQLNVKKHYNDIELPDARRGQRVVEQMDRMKEAYKVMEAHKMLTSTQVKTQQKAFKQMADAAKESSAATSLAAKVNHVRGKAAGEITERLGRVKQGAQDFKAQKTASMVEEAVRYNTFGAAAKRAIALGNVVANAPISGVAAIRAMDRHDKTILFDHLTREIAKMTGAPEYMEEQFSGILGATGDADPDVTMLGASSAARTIHYLSTSLPKPSYSVHGGLETSTMQKEAFLQKFGAIMDPVSVAYAALEGRATPSMIEALRVTQQAAYAELSNFMAEAMAEATPKASRKTINGVQAFLGGLDPLYHGEVLMQLQSNYSHNQQQDQAINGPAMQGQFKDTSNPQKGNDFTFAQRLQSS